MNETSRQLTIRPTDRPTDHPNNLRLLWKFLRQAQRLFRIPIRQTICPNQPTTPDKSNPTNRRRISSSWAQWRSFRRKMRPDLLWQTRSRCKEAIGRVSRQSEEDLRREGRRTAWKRKRKRKKMRSHRYLVRLIGREWRWRARRRRNICRGRRGSWRAEDDGGGLLFWSVEGELGSWRRERPRKTCPGEGRGWEFSRTGEGSVLSFASTPAILTKWKCQFLLSYKFQSNYDKI